MKIRDSHARIEGNETTHEMHSGGVDVIADDGRTLFCVSLTEAGNIHVSVSGHCKHGGVILDDAILIKPKASNCVEIIRRERLDYLKSKRTTA